MDTAHAIANIDMKTGHVWWTDDEGNVVPPTDGVHVGVVESL